MGRLWLAVTASCANWLHESFIVLCPRPPTWVRHGIRLSPIHCLVATLAYWFGSYIAHTYFASLGPRPSALLFTCAPTLHIVSRTYCICHVVQ